MQKKFDVSVYVACSSKELARYKDFVAKLLDLDGISLTQNWSKNIELASKLGYTSDEDLSDAVATQVYSTCRRGVKSADIFVFLSPKTPTRGAWYEAGLADGDCQMVAVGNPGSAFRSAFHKIFDTEHDLLTWLAEISGWNSALNSNEEGV